jgi:ribose 5-phosphate isomerase B
MKNDDKIIIGADHAGFNLKEEMKPPLAFFGLAVTDVGSENDDPTDYPDFAARVAGKVSSGEFGRGILICGSGAGMVIVANKFPRVRAVLCLNEDMARLCRLHNDANVLVLAGRITAVRKAIDIVAAWLNTPFEGARHQLRLDKIREIEDALCKSAK